MGDVGHVDEDGYVFLSDRAANMIISGGVNIYPAEIEQVLIEHPAVADVAVFGIPDDEWGEQVKAAVELPAGYEPSADLEADLLLFARERLAGFKVPRSVDFEDELPRHPTGKLYTRLLRDKYWQDRATRCELGGGLMPDSMGRGRRWCAARSGTTNPACPSSSARARTASSRRRRRHAARARAPSAWPAQTCDDAARRLGMSRRDFLRTLDGVGRHPARHRRLLG